jgi:hypothetical protein
MKATKLIVLLGGVLGVLAFFLPMAKVSHQGAEVSISAAQLFTGVDELQEKVEATTHVDGLTAEQLGKNKTDVAEVLQEIKGIVLVCFLPALLLVLIGMVALVRRRFGRLGGALALLLGVVELLVFYGLRSGADAAEGGGEAGIAMYLLAVSGLLAAGAGMVAVVTPDHGPQKPAKA